MNNGVKWGVIGGIGIIIIDAILYFTGPKNLLGFASYLEWIVIIPVMIKAGMDERADQGGHLTWGDALKPTFLTFVISSLFYVFFYFALFNFIDPTLADTQREVAMQAIEKMGGMIGEDAMEAAVEAMDQQNFGFGMKELFMTYGLRLIFPGFIFAAICSLIVKKNPPESAAFDQA